MATLPEGLTQADIDEYARLDAGLKKLQTRHAVLNETIKQSHKNAGITGNKTLTYPSEKYGTVIVKLGEQKRLDTEKLSETFPESEFPEYYTCSVDAKKVPADISAEFRTNIIQTLSISVAE